MHILNSVCSRVINIRIVHKLINFTWAQSTQYQHELPNIQHPNNSEPSTNAPLNPQSLVELIAGDNHGMYGPRRHVHLQINGVIAVQGYRSHCTPVHTHLRCVTQTRVVQREGNFLGRERLVCWVEKHGDTHFH